ncbi:hypothetical protein F4553_007601 [Allocatelliglobosispora scoriae]|uniref:Uncharacterized protein n=1 Tax=Allocatelliglobosispora scoriae TaxID=643052 RepID=A0A841BYD9_9ACTN|nr:hypothetical protein [Allocatelliglobosispora scoriae]MBB5874167.1 hypothetical protein [Allocatelliglobosispora scoriae]
MRIARIFDGVTADAGPRMAADHAKAEPAAAERLSAYLRSGVLVLGSAATLDDVVDPARGAVVPMSFRTDGDWVWCEAVAYYVEEHGLLPEAEFVAAIQARGFVHRPVDDATLRLALTVLLEPDPADGPAWVKPG